METYRNSLEELSEEYVAKRAKGLQHLVLRYASLNPEITLDAPQFGEYDLDNLDQSPENINTLEERQDFEDETGFEANIEEYPDNIQELTKTLGWSEDSFDSLNLRSTLNDLNENIAQEVGNLLALEKTGYLSDLDSETQNDYSARRELLRACEWIESIDTKGYLDPNREILYDFEEFEDILPENGDLRPRHEWEFETLSKHSRFQLDFFTEEVDAVIELDSGRLILYSGEINGSDIEGEMTIERDDGSTRDIEGKTSIDNRARRKTDQIIISERKRSVAAS